MQGNVHDSTLLHRNEWMNSITRKHLFILAGGSLTYRIKQALLMYEEAFHYVYKLHTKYHPIEKP